MTSLTPEQIAQRLLQWEMAAQAKYDQQMEEARMIEFYRPDWETLSLNEREKLIVLHARNYAKNYAEAGIPGSNHILLIAKLAALLDEANANPETKEDSSLWGRPPERDESWPGFSASDDVIRDSFSPNRDS
jgi:hypothetical protein